MEGQFVANRAVVWLAYPTRHGMVTAENESNFIEIYQRLQRKYNLFLTEGMRHPGRKT
jgi:hypothetical protein